MKNFILSLTLVVFLLLSACTGRIAAESSDEMTVSHGNAVVDQVSLIDALRAAGATVESGDSVEQPFFAVSGQILPVNQTEVQVFEYGTAEAMETDASLVASDGASVGTTMISWIAPPHFYKTGRIIVLYLGEDTAVLDLLNQVLGVQFAGG
ncbi:MAG: hypothetical protein ACYC6K_05125 [Bellilinea sp.]